MSSALNKIKEGVRVFFRYISWKKILTFSIFVVVAAILWFMQIYNKYFETTLTVPIKYVSVPDSIVFKDSLPGEIKIRIRDDGFSMFKYYLSKSDTLRLNVNAIIKNSSNKVLQGASFDEYIRNSLSRTSQVLSYEPVRISFSYAPLDHKKLPVIFDGSINLASGYLLSNDITIVPDSVTVYGSKNELNKLLYIYTDKDTINGLESSKSFPVELLPINNVKISPQKINVYVSVEAYVQKSVDIPVECQNLPDDITVKFFPSKVKLLFYTGVSKSDSIKASDFSVAVDYQELIESTKASIPVRITSSSEYAKSLTITPPNVEFIFEHK